MSRKTLLRIRLPLQEMLGRFLPQGARDRLERGLLEKNNRLVKGPVKKILLLLPHCIQFDGCTYKVTGTSINCKNCGKCAIPGLLTLSKKYNIIMKIATGGRLARRMVQEIAPDAVIAVACERELTEGIFNVYPVPVYGIINIRPQGPCVNTTVDLQLVEDTLLKLLPRQS